MKIFSIIFVLQSINLLLGGYLFDSINDPENRLKSVIILNDTITSFKMLYNDDYMMNMTEKYIKGTAIYDIDLNNFTIGWNTSLYIGEF